MNRQVAGLQQRILLEIEAGMNDAMHREMRGTLTKEFFCLFEMPMN